MQQCNTGTLYQWENRIFATLRGISPLWPRLPHAGHFLCDSANSGNLEVIYVFCVSSETIIEGKYVLRVACIDHRSWREDLDILVHEVIRIGTKLTVAIQNSPILGVDMHAHVRWLRRTSLCVLDDLEKTNSRVDGLMPSYTSFNIGLVRQFQRFLASLLMLSDIMERGTLVFSFSKKFCELLLRIQ